MTAVQIHSVSVQGIVLRRSPLGENDQIFTIYTHQLGKIRAAARGSTKPKSSLRGILELFHQIQADLIHTNKSSLYRFETAEVIGRPAGFLRHLTALHSAYLILECLDRYCEPENANPELYQEVISVLSRINQLPDHAGYFVRCFCFRFFMLSGYAIRWSTCVRCERSRPPDRSAYCIPEAGGVVCSNCASSDDARKEWIVEADVLKLAAAAADGHPVPTDQFDPDMEKLFDKRSDRLIREIFAHYLDGVPKTLMMLEALG